jgi:release factor glutamine methyltransferase
MDIYEPREDSYLLQKHVAKYATGCVLDVGTGSGIQALTAIKNSNVRDVVAVDINTLAIAELNDKIKQQKLRKIKAITSNLFENITTKFDLIIFNPPYLPQDEGIVDPALYGGKKGWEVSGEFLQQASEYLVPHGKILFLFSTLTNKEKIEAIIQENLLQFKQIDSLKISFEELYVYEITKTPLLRELQRQELEQIRYLTSGKRGMIFTGYLEKSKRIKTHFAKKEKIKVGIKIKKEQSQAQNTIANEAYWLRTLNKYQIGPRYLFHNQNYVVYKFIEGEFILDWIINNDKSKILNVLRQILQQCREMDRLQVNKEELHHPYKHILITADNQPVMLDFERCSKTEKPQNVTQCIEFFSRMANDLSKKEIVLNKEELRELAQEYKDTYSEKAFQEILKKIK